MSAENPSGEADRGQILLIVLVVLALVASLVMLFADSDGALKIALLAALWAAIIGSFLVFRYRKAAEATQTELEHRDELHRAELDKATLERDSEQGRKELELRERQHERDSEVLAEIQRELALLRTQLEQLAGREFGYEPAALRAEARRIMELEQAARAGVGWPEDDGDGEDDDGEAVIPEPVFKHEGRFSGAPSPDAIAGRLGQHETSRPQLNPLADLIAENMRRAEKGAGVPTLKDEARVEEETTDKTTATTPDTDKATRMAAPKADAKAGEKESAEQPGPRPFDTGSFQTVSWDQGGAGKSRAAQAKADEVKAEKATKPAKADKPVESEAEKAEREKQEASLEDTRRGRRRRDEHSGALSVAELLARSRANEED